MKRIYYITLSLLAGALFILSSCVEENTFDTTQYVLSFTPTLSTNVSDLEIDSNGGNRSIGISCNTSWIANSSASWLTLSPTSGTGKATLTVTASANTSTSNRSGTVTFKAGGTTYTVNVTQDGKSDSGSHAYVDLDLSVKWATCNVGASSPEEYGDYFAWGETATKSNYSWETLKYRTSGDSDDNVKFSKYVTNSSYGTVDNKTVLELSDDAARQNWGGSWRMPTYDEFKELLNNCTWTWTTQGGHNGYKVVSKSNGNSIFLPAAGYRSGTSLGGAGSYGYYWSSSLYSSFPNYAWFLYFYSSYRSMDGYYRRFGLSVRPVYQP